MARTVLAPTAATASRISDTFSAGRSFGFWVDVTATPNNAETLMFILEARNPITGKWAAIYSSAALAGSVFGATPTDRNFFFGFDAGVAADAWAGTANDVTYAPMKVPKDVELRIRGVQSASGSWTYGVYAI